MNPRPTLALVVIILVFVWTACKKQSPSPKKETTVAEKVEPPSKPPVPAPPPAPPEGDADPQYPTPAAAGTEKIFYLEEPDRGPEVQPVTLPPRKTLKWRTAAHCEPHEAGIACSTAPGRRWKLGSKGGQVVVAQEEVGHGTYFFKRDGSGRLEMIVRIDGRGTTKWTRFFDREKKRFSARRLNGANALSGCGHMAYKLDKAGHLEELTCLQWTGKPMRDTRGIRARRFRRDGRGFVLEEKNVTPGGDPMADNDGVHRKTYRRDEAGRPLEVRLLDIEGKAAMSARSGCHGERNEYDGRGFLIRETCLGAEGKATAGQSGAHAEAYERDARGCLTRLRYLDAQGKPTSDRYGVHAFTYRIIGFCQHLVESCTDESGALVACGPGRPARSLFRYDRRGFRVSSMHYDANRRPGLDVEYRVFEVRRERDARGNAIGESCFGAGGRAVECEGTGFHATKVRFDQAGREVERRFLDKKGAATTNLGCAVRRFRYDNYDHQYEATDHDSKGQVIESYDKATLRTLYDQSHRRFAILLLDKQGQPSRYNACFTGVDCPPRSWHAARIVRDAKGAVAKNLYFDHKKKLVHTVDCRLRRCWD